MSEENPTPAEIEATKARVMEAALTASAAAERHCFRTQTDFIGRMNEVESTIMEADDAEEAGELTLDLSEERADALAELASLCIARLALLRQPA
jgi:predicted secreted Zn-dependent protease